MFQSSIAYGFSIVLTASVASAQDLVFPVGEGAFNWENFAEFEALDFTGQQITVLGTWLGPELIQAQNVLAYFERATGADVRYSGVQDFAQQVVIAAEAGSPPDIAIFPQPGLAADLASRGFLVPLGADIEDAIRETYSASQSWIDIASFAGPDGTESLYGIFYKTSLKSLVWYVPENFDDAGYEVPETMEQLIALTDQIAQEGETPWCIGLGSGAATGWPATDWIEDILLRLSPPEVYDGWVTNEIAFTDPRVLEAIEAFGTFALNEDYVAGGVTGVATTDFRDSPLGLFAAPPDCYMHRQGSFIPTFFPDEVEIGLDVDFFYFPAYQAEGLGQPVIGAGNMVTLMNDTPAARALVDFFQAPISHELWMAQGGFVTPHAGANVELYAEQLERRLGEILLAADVFRFDGSDLMPGSVGTGTFWTGMMDYIGGAPAADIAAHIETGWRSANQ